MRDALKSNLIIEIPPDNITLIFNKFGDPTVAYYRIYGGTTPQPTTLLDTSTSTLKHISEGLENGLRYYFGVLQPFKANRFNNPKVFNALQPGENILAIHGTNDSTVSNDFLISAQLHAGI